jgi:hypothetical protein
VLRVPRLLRLLATATVAIACARCIAESSVDIAPDDGPPPAVEPQEPVLHRLTRAQYVNAVRDLIGSDVILSGPIEPDASFAGLIAVGASRTTVSPWGVEQYEAAAYDLAEQAMDTAERRAALVPCTPDSNVDLSCASRFVESFGRRAWRRPLEGDEIARITSTATTAGAALGDFYDGLEFAIAAILQSPSFLFRVELGEPDPDHEGGRRYTSYEMAARLSFLVWNTTPDDELLQAAEDGALVTDAGIQAQVDRLLASPRARAGLRTFFTDMFELHRLDSLSKDPTIFTHYSAELGPAAREETLADLEQLIFDLDGDYRDLFILDRTIVDRRLAAVYGVRAGSRDGFKEVSLPRDGQRRGLLGQVSVLALQAHPVSSSATKRGKFVRQVLLCGDVPPPPVNVNTALPEPTGTALTLRDRVKEHLTNPTCAGCHSLMDPIGLGLENFDGIGRLRSEDHGATINPSSELDGVPFADAWELAEAVRSHPKLPGCLARSMYRYATGNVESEGETEQLEALTRRFVRSGHSVLSLLRGVALSPGFRRTKEPTP